MNKDLRGGGEGVANVKLGEEHSRHRSSQFKGPEAEASPASSKISKEATRQKSSEEGTPEKMRLER